MVRTPARSNRLASPDTPVPSVLACYRCTKQETLCQIDPGEAKCKECKNKHSRCNANGAMPSFSKPALEKVYLEALFSKNPTFKEEWFTKGSRIPAEVTEWTPPSTEVKVKAPKKGKQPANRAEAAELLTELAERIPKLAEELAECRRQYEGYRILYGLSEFEDL